MWGHSTFSLGGLGVQELQNVHKNENITVWGKEFRVKWVEKNLIVFLNDGIL